MTYDSSNRLTGRQATGQSKETTAYDAAGRPIAMKDGTGQPTRSMSYGYGDKALETKNHGINTGFYYNAEGQLVGKKTSSGVASYAWDGNVLAADGAETFTNEAHISGGVPIISSGTDVVVSDYLGTTLVSGDEQFVSSVYGEGLENGRYTGKPFVSELCSYVFPHRLYSPETNRWSTSDPSGFPDGTNNLSYVSGKPSTLIDPSGLTETSTFDTEIAQGTAKITVQTILSWEKQTGTQLQVVATAFVGKPTGNISTGGTWTWISPGATVKNHGTFTKSKEPINPQMCWVEGVSLEARGQYTESVGGNFPISQAISLKTKTDEVEF